MPRSKIPFIRDLTRWFGSLQARVERRPLVLAKVGHRLVALTAVNISLATVVTSFDLVIVTNALEHLPEPVALLADMRHVLRGRVSQLRSSQSDTMQAPASPARS